ncbi:MAG: hypothetical protein K9G24_00400 [Candidatus Nanopelagicales bacterium]|nr:hypothetical protein [Candidatus Nanopelagicales bacterium]MCF8536403.1 hypothetical protein [Candidatus Nanopelagicales bacterium]MCF8541517.1 hypothetical protein [Candidatus Nanopelagicales bacterium]
MSDDLAGPVQRSVPSPRLLSGNVHGGRTRVRGRVALLLLGGVSMLLGLSAGLMLLGLPAPITAERLLEVHGQLMIVGFLGTLIALERAIALRRAWAYAAPLATGVGALLLVTPVPMAVGLAVQAVGLGILVTIYAAVWRRAASTALAIQWLGSFLALAAGLLWLAQVPTGALFPLLAGFLVLTIAGERLELAHVASPRPGAARALMLISAAVAITSAAALLWPTPGSELFGASLLATVLWLLRFDVATRTIRSVGLPRYTAVNLLLGMAWLAVAAFTWLTLGPQPDGPGYDIVVHAIGLGFAMSMVLAHAPIILPAVLIRPLPYRPVLYLATFALQASLLLRVAGDVRGSGWAWQSGGAGNVAALMAFVAMAAALVIRR